MMLHRICDYCGEMESVDFMIAIDDNIYCIECNDRKENNVDTTKTTHISLCSGNGVVPIVASKAFVILMGRLNV